MIEKNPLGMEDSLEGTSADLPSAAALSNYVSSTRFDHLPARVIDWVTVLVEDSLGCALGALAMPESRSILAVADTDAGAGSAVAIGGVKTSVNSAVFCNAQLANWLDFDDMFDYFPPFHPGCMIVPAALAVAQSIGAAGRDFLTAVAVAYEVTMRVGRSIGNTMWTPGLPWGAIAELGPAIAAAKLYEFDAVQIRTLLSIVAMDEGSFARQARAKNDIPSTYRHGTLKGNLGTRAQIGLWAAMKARAGLTGRPGMLEATFSDWYLAGLPATGFTDLTSGLGKEYVTTQMSLKPVPACRTTHPPITAAWNALGGKRVDARHVANIRIFGVPRLHRVEALDMFGAQFSIPCTLALALSGIEPGPRWYLDGAYKSEAVRELAAKVVQEVDPAAQRTEILEGRMTCRIEIKLKHGTTLEGECTAVKGSPELPLTAHERRAKFSANTAHIGRRGQEIGAAIHELAGMRSVETLCTALAAAR